MGILLTHIVGTVPIYHLVANKQREKTPIAHTCEKTLNLVYQAKILPGLGEVLLNGDAALELPLGGNLQLPNVAGLLHPGNPHLAS